MFLSKEKTVSNSENVNVYERILKLLSAILKMVVDGVRDPHKVAEALQVIVNETTTYLRRLYEVETITVGATDGTETFASSGLFTGGVYGLTLPVAVKPTTATRATVWEMILDGIFTQLFGSLGEARRRWTESQVVAFVRSHRDKLRTDGYGTFFEIEGGFVANVHVGDCGRLSVDVYGVSGGGVWHATYRRRLVSLQQ
jgi:predicted DNA-binding transcriptional regulator AlpA